MAVIGVSHDVLQHPLEQYQQKPWQTPTITRKKWTVWLSSVSALTDHLYSASMTWIRPPSEWNSRPWITCRARLFNAFFLLSLPHPHVLSTLVDCCKNNEKIFLSCCDSLVLLFDCEAALSVIQTAVISYKTSHPCTSLWGIRPWNVILSVGVGK